MTAMLLSPATYYQIAQTVSWRLHWPSVSQEQLEQTLTGLQLRGDSMVRAGDTLLFGDSHLHAVPSARFGNAVNYSIGGETAEHLARRIGRYSSIQRAANIVILTGRNDLAAKTPATAIESSIARVLAQIPPTVNVTLVEIPPAVEADTEIEARRETNRRYRDQCGERVRCRFVTLKQLEDPQGRLQPQFDAGDGVHLNSIGYELMLTAIVADQSKR